MKNNLTYTSTLKKELYNQLNSYSKKLKEPKNKIIETALNKFFNDLKRAEYAVSFKKANSDTEMKALAEMGLNDYLKIISDLE